MPKDCFHDESKSLKVINQHALSHQIKELPIIASNRESIPQSVCSESCRPGFRKSAQEGKAVCCFDCTLCADNEISNETE
ncbi:Vomeronasal 2, receptor, pseudogene 158 [Apodemus speciosus]